MDKGLNGLFWIHESAPRTRMSPKSTSAEGRLGSSSLPNRTSSQSRVALNTMNFSRLQESRRNGALAQRPSPPRGQSVGKALASLEAGQLPGRRLSVYLTSRIPELSSWSTWNSRVSEACPKPDSQRER